MPRPRKIKSPDDFGKEFEKLKKPRKRGVNTFHGEPITEEQFDKIYNEVQDENAGKSPLNELQELEKKLRACTDETPRDISYVFLTDEVVLQLAYNNIEVNANIFATSRYFTLKTAKSYLETAQEMLEVLKEWRGE